MTRCLYLWLLLFVWPLAAAAQAIERPAPRIVMNLAAHPDDEDGLTMAYYRHARNAVVHSVIYNRGEGGQNELGPELYAHLGAIRTAETEAAARLLGTQVRFLNFDDFGFSKTAAETFARWGGEDEVTARLVHVIRKLKPDVLFTNHDTVTVGPRRQHGHHQAVGISAYRAMRLAADPSYRPEQLLEPGVDLWQPQRLFVRYRGGPARPDASVPVGDPVAALGRSPMEVAVEAVAEHRSQGFDLLTDRFRRDTTHFVLLWQAPGAAPLPPGATDLAAGLPPNPYATDVDLAYLIDSGRVPPLPSETVSIDHPVAVPGGTFVLSWSAPDGQHLALSGAIDTTLSRSPAEVRIPAEATHTLPRERAQYLRQVNHPPVQVALVSRDGAVVASQHLPLELAPPILLEVQGVVSLPLAYRPRLLLTPGDNEITVSGRLFAADVAEIGLGLAIGEAGAEQPLALTSRRVPASGGRFSETVRVRLPADLVAGAYDVAVAGWVGDALGDELALDGRILPPIDLPPGLRVGFVRSYDATTETALRHMGATVVPLDSLALADGRFDGLQIIVVDIRAYLDRPDLRAHNDRLLEWVRDGGHLVVTYHKTFEWNVEHFQEEEVSPGGFAPYPLRLGRQRVTQADAPVRHLQPAHPLFHHPNPIRPEDWDGWIQERGLYFPAEYDERYVELLAMADPDEDELRSSTLFARYGHGTYVYTALGWYRQLGAFVPGAYRIFANLISLPLVDGREVAATQ